MKEIFFISLYFLLFPLKLFAQEHSHKDEPSLHFSHPIFAESIYPDTKIRVDYFFTDRSHINVNDFNLIAEYDLTNLVSLEVKLPYTIFSDSGGESNSSLNNIELGLKFANYALREKGILMGYGISLHLPTGNEEESIGSDNIIEFAPFLNAGFKRGGWELMFWTKYAIPTNQEKGEEVETEFELNLTSLYHITRKFQGILELDHSSELSGPEAGEGGGWSLMPGIKFAPFEKAFFLGAGYRFPLNERPEYDQQVLISLFYHIQSHEK